LLKEVSNSKLTDILKTKQWEQVKRVDTFNSEVTAALIEIKNNDPKKALKEAIAKERANGTTFTEADEALIKIMTTDINRNLDEAI
jgi:hypothetical protein|tara:strand:- start:15 stop:272 length:258 start_codon:yes stop_codon:yes gene_type:complete